MEYYLGFEIVHYCSGVFRCDYYRIKKDGKSFSFMALASVKACHNVIDTYMRSLCFVATQYYLNT